MDTGGKIAHKERRKEEGGCEKSYRCKIEFQPFLDLYEISQGFMALPVLQRDNETKGDTS